MNVLVYSEMIIRPMISLCLVLIAAGCVDRIIIPLGKATSRVVIDGFISTEPGPYSIRVSESLDIQSTYEVARPITLKYLVLMDDLDNVDSLFEHKTGSFFTPDDGLRGTPGRAYKIKFETVDGREYESVYDTLYGSTGSVDGVHHTYVQRNRLEDGSPSYGFDINFDASDNESKRNLHMWRMVSTYQVETIPKYHRAQCGGPLDEYLLDPLPVDQQCPFPVNCGCIAPLPCSGWELNKYRYVYDGPCTCCDCWVQIYNNVPIMPDQKLYDTRLTNVFADHIPLTYYNFMFAMHVQIDQYTLSHKIYLFYKAIVNQQSARGSLFQPITGKLPGNIVQISGNPIPAEGIFYATAITSNSIFIDRSEIANKSDIPRIAPYPFANKTILNSCLDFPYSTNIKPSYWP
jgi:hypothetical protein